MSSIFLAALALAIGAALGWLLARRTEPQRIKNALATQIAPEVASLQAKLALTEQRAATLQAEIDLTRDSYLKLSNDHAVLIAKFESLTADRSELSETFRGLANAIFSEKKESIQSIVAPLQTALNTLNQATQDLEVTRVTAFSNLETQLSNITTLSTSLQSETSKLATALSNPDVSGDWGEQMLENVVKLAGMTEHCDFQHQVSSKDGSYRPDLIIMLGNGRRIIVDSKTSVRAYQEAYSTPDPELKRTKLVEHTKKIKSHISSLGSKAYERQFEDSLDLVICFIPGDVFHVAALSTDPEIWEFAAKKNVLLTTPTTLLGLLKAVAFGWQQEAMTREAKEVKREAQVVYDRLVRAATLLEKLRKSISSVVSGWDELAGSLEGGLMPAARRMRDLGVSGGGLPELKTLDIVPRSLRKPDWALSAVADSDPAVAAASDDPDLPS
jgi:DNA recombination protein RmuC